MSPIRLAAVAAFALSITASAEKADLSKCINGLDLQQRGSQELIPEKLDPRTKKIVSKKYQQKDLVVPTFYNGKPGILFVSGSGTQFIDLSKYAILKLPAETLPDGTQLPPLAVNPRNGIRIKAFKIQFKVPGKFGAERLVSLSGNDFRYFPLKGGEIQNPLDWTVRDGSQLPGNYDVVKPEPAPTTTAQAAISRYLAGKIDRKITEVSKLFPLTVQSLKDANATMPPAPLHAIGFANPKIYADFKRDAAVALLPVSLDLFANARQIPADNSTLLNGLRYTIATCPIGSDEVVAFARIDQTIKKNAEIAPKMQTLLAATLPKFFEEKKPLIGQPDEFAKQTSDFIAKAVLGARALVKPVPELTPFALPASPERHMASNPSAHE